MINELLTDKIVLSSSNAIETEELCKRFDFITS